MKKSIGILGAVLLSSTTLLGAGQVFADDVKNAETPVSAELTLKETLDPEDKPSVPQPDTPGEKPGEKPTEIEGLFGIAYAPKDLSAKAQLNKNGEQKISLSAGEGVTKKLNVGVQDKTRKKTHTWTLKAQLSWKNDTNNYMQGTSVEATDGNVTENKAGKLTPLTNDEVTTTAQSLKITQESEVDVMKASKGKTMNGVYNYQFNNPQLVIPEVSTVSAGNYSGNISWNLTDAE